MLCLYYCGPDMKDNLKRAQQVRIDFRPNDETFKKFIETYQDKTIYIRINDENIFKSADEMRKLQEIKQFENWILQIPSEFVIDNKNRFNAIKDCCNKYMFTDMIDRWESLEYLLTFNPCEVYLTNYLGFCLADAKKVCDKAEVGIRLYANLAQRAWSALPALKSFFIAPTDIEIYESYTSGIDFWGDDPVFQNTLFDIYSRGYWFGDLQEIIIGLDESLDNRRLPKYFGELRAKCNKRCITGGNCNVCKVTKNFMETLEKTDTIFKLNNRDRN